MGGIDPVAPKKSEQEVIAGAIAAGQNCQVPTPHTAWCVVNPTQSTLFYHSRSDIDNICFAVPIDHLTVFKWPLVRMQINNTTFYRYEDRQAAMDDALSRLAMVGLRCRFCHGVCHPASGSQYTPTFIVCGTCIQPYIDVMDKVAKEGLPAYLEKWTGGKGKRKLSKFPGAKSFYEAAGKFMGQDNRIVIA